MDPQAETDLWFFFPPSVFLLSSFFLTPSLLGFTLENFEFPSVLQNNGLSLVSTSQTVSDPLLKRVLS